MVTKMELASCSDDSDNDADVAVKKVEKVAEVKLTKASPKKNGDVKKPAPASTAGSGGKPKQASIMNFFTKK